MVGVMMDTKIASLLNHQPSEQTASSGEKILLLVDDEANILASLVRLFRRDGYTLLTAQSGNEGLALIEQHPVGVIISDQRMPGMVGSEFLARAKDLRPETIRMILSGYTELNTVTDAINLGAVFKFLTKPWDDELLRDHVREAFKQYELRTENLRLANELQITNQTLEKLVNDLEGCVAQATQELQDTISTLQVGQEILDTLPIGVIGTDEQGLITVANQKASTIFNAQPLIGNEVRYALPLGLQPMSDWCESKYFEANNIPMEVRFSKLGTASKGRGWIIILIPRGPL